MSLADLRLTLMAFPQRWTGSVLELRILVSPRGNPLEPLVPETPPFAQAALVLNALLIPGLQRLPRPEDVTAQVPLNLTAPVNAQSLFQALADSFPIDPNPPPAVPPSIFTHIKKYLPPSYQAAFAFERPRSPFAFTDRTYACALENAVNPNRPPRPPPPQRLGWGRVLALALRQPLLAEALGLMYRTRVTPPAANFFRDGGWIYLGLAPASSYAAEANAVPDLVKVYAARLPPLEAGAAAARPVFAAVLFPIRAIPGPGSFDEIFLEVESYDDGFGKIVHTLQPDRHDQLDLADGGRDRSKPITDSGIKLGWDDEQLTIWMNRQLVDDPRHGAPDTRDTPMGVRAYRVDVREQRNGNQPGAWSSLMKAQGKLSLNQIDLGVFNGELGIEASPVQLQGEKDGDYWLPAYFTQWNGTSLALPDPTRDLLNDVTPPVGMLQPVDLDKVPLRYGRSYEFRVRLADLTGGGPEPDDVAVNRSSAGTGSCLFRRFVPPKSVSFSDPQLSADGQTVTYDVFRPLLSYPALVFSDFPNARQALIDDVANAKIEKREVGLPDPDVTILRVDVAVGSVEFDPANLPEEGEPLRSLYTAVRSFPADPKSALTLTFQYQDAPDIAVFPSPGPTAPLSLPTGRNIRVILTPIAQPDPASETGTADPVLVPNPDDAAIDSPDPQLRYFGSQAARVGLPSTIRLRRESDSETGLLRDLPGRPFQVVMLQPDPAPGKFQANVQATARLQGQTPLDLVQRLAQQLGLLAEGLFFTGQPGRRTIFGSSAALRHLLSPDHSGIAFATKADLTGH